MRGICTICIIASLTCLAGPSDDAGAVDPPAVTTDLRDRSVRTLRETLERESLWPKVHAAEFLIGLSYPDQVAETYEAERTVHEEQPQYRIGIWRVLAQCAPSPSDRAAWIERIKQVLADPAATDHVHSMESLAKLGVRVGDPDFRAHVERAADEDARAKVMADWLLAGSGDLAALVRLTETLGSTDPQSRLLAAYALQWLRTGDPAVWKSVQAAADAEPADSPARIYLLAAATVLAPSEEDAAAYRERLVDAADHGTAGDRYHAGFALASRGTTRDVPTLTAWLDDPDPDARAAAAAALLRIDRRGTHLLGWFDWCVIGLYFTGMLAIGAFYARRTKTADDYLLGGRSMKPWAVGLSLFATLLSTITYLSTPGEMILHGPMYYSMLLGYPLVALVVGWGLIPYFTRVPLTSAYEILETRLGTGVRMLGAIFFLSLRLLWMAVIVEATASIVLVPLLGLDEGVTPYICIVLAIITVAYTSLGGMRAVVWTDVVQTFVLLGGALVALALITWNLGGVQAWWPTAWAPNWDPPKLGYDPHARVTLFGAVLAMFSWHVCTAGSDQMAIQRYLSTRDVYSARRMFNVSLIASSVVIVTLAMLGLALLAYFQAHPELLGDNQSVDRNADQLFPRFIAIGLPAGISGLVVAGLLAAAMSSLSSGLNSSCAVITVDFLDRFGSRVAEGAASVRRTRYVSWCVGVIVVLLSSAVGIVQGNLLEVAFKVTNLLVAPLFGLFFMALFVRWATSFGTFVGAAFGLATVVTINYWAEISYWTGITDRPGISFLWAMPLGLAIQVAAGSIASLLPIGAAKPMLFETLPDDQAG